MKREFGMAIVVALMIYLFLYPFGIAHGNIAAQTEYLRSALIDMKRSTGVEGPLLIHYKKSPIVPGSRVGWMVTFCNQRPINIYFDEYMSTFMDKHGYIYGAVLLAHEINHCVMKQRGTEPSDVTAAEMKADKLGLDLWMKMGLNPATYINFYVLIGSKGNALYPSDRIRAQALRTYLDSARGR